ncbi:Dyp-type peroxidase [Lentzea chajnantorensis]
MIDRRDLLVGAGLGTLLACLGLSGCGTPGTDPPGTHPVLRTPRPAGALALLRARGTDARARLLGVRGDDVMVGLGPTLADVPVMPDFPGETLDRDRSRTDAFVQVEGDDRDDCADRLAEVLAELPGLTPVWTVPVHRDVAPPLDGKHLQRNPFGFVEGQTNEQSVLLPDGDTLAALRVIRLAHPLWDADSAEAQARIIGRHPDGTWLDGTPPGRVPDYAGDPDGVAIPLNSHVRAMNPRTGDTPAPRMLRRSWIYQETPAETGVVFMAFQSSFEDGFARAQSRLASDALHPYLLTTAGGYYRVPA